MPDDDEFDEFDTPPAEVAKYLREGDPVEIISRDDRVGFPGRNPEDVLRALLATEREPTPVGIRSGHLVDLTFESNMVVTEHPVAVVVPADDEPGVLSLS